MINEVRKEIVDRVRFSTEDLEEYISDYMTSDISDEEFRQLIIGIATELLETAKYAFIKLKLAQLERN